jgi:hypothetical protein
VSRTQNRGYDVLAQDPNGHDSLRVNRLGVRSQTQVSSGARLDLQVFAAQGTAEVSFVDNLQQGYPDQHFQDRYAAGSARKSASWRDLVLTVPASSGSRTSPSIPDGRS